MHRRQALKALAGFALCPLCASNGFAAEEAHWNYCGADGPDHWGDLNPPYWKACSAGTQQSPIDIANPVTAPPRALYFAWANSADTIENNGHTIQLNFANGGTLKVDNDSITYSLVQFHFHQPSEHLISGKSFAMELHFVHQYPAPPSAPVAYGVLGVLMTSDGYNNVFHQIVSSAPATKGEPVKLKSPINPYGLVAPLPPPRGYYRYAGSLTTPGCDQTVDWLLLAAPIRVAEADIAKYRSLFPSCDGTTARPVQKLNGRSVLWLGGP